MLHIGEMMVYLNVKEEILVMGTVKVDYINIPDRLTACKNR